MFEQRHDPSARSGAESAGTAVPFPSTMRVALMGNPNTGKSTLFSALVGVHQHVGNYPGVTVEKKLGRMRAGRQEFEVIDLPGLYSLAVRSRDEQVALDVLLGRIDGDQPVDAILCVVDAGNLCRNFYLLSQLIELGRPMVVAVNMVDVAERRGMRVDCSLLERRLGVPVVPTQAHRGIGIDEIKAALLRVRGTPPPELEQVFPAEFEREAELLEGEFDSCGMPRCACRRFRRGMVRRMLLDVHGRMHCGLDPAARSRWLSLLDSARARLGEAGVELPGVEPPSRYAWAQRVLDGVVSVAADRPPTATDRIDRFLTHPIFGLAVFAAVMAVMFQAVFLGAKPLIDAAAAGVDAVSGAASHILPEGALRDLIVDGVIAGVGSVVVFVPQIAILFVFIAVLEDCGYMARAAFLMDRLMVRVGLSGKSFIPMLSSFACAVPGIMATRVIEDERDRLATIFAAPLLTCSARLPVYGLLIGAFIPDYRWVYGIVGLQGLVLGLFYLLGIVAAVATALLLKRTVLRGESPPLLLELPSYKRPSASVVVMRVAQRVWVFLRTAGTLILAISVLVWAALYFPRNTPTVGPLLAQRQAIEAVRSALPADLAEDDPRRTSLDEQLAELSRAIDMEFQQHSLLASAGRWIEPVVRPLGWDWRIGCAVMASFPAREVVVATMGVMYQFGDLEEAADKDIDRVSRQLRSVRRDGSDEPAFTVPVALSIMVFFALCIQCGATLAVIRRETNSWRWPAFAFAYMTTLAYVGALATYQIAAWLALRWA